MFVRFLTGVGAVVLAVFIYLGELVVLAAETMRSAVTHRVRWRLFLRSARQRPWIIPPLDFVNVRRIS